MVLHMRCHPMLRETFLHHSTARALSYSYAHSLIHSNAVEASHKSIAWWAGDMYYVRLSFIYPNYVLFTIVSFMYIMYILYLVDVVCFFLWWILFFERGTPTTTIINYTTIYLHIGNHQLHYIFQYTLQNFWEFQIQYLLQCLKTFLIIFYIPIAI